MNLAEQVDRLPNLSPYNQPTTPTTEQETGQALDEEDTKSSTLEKPIQPRQDDEEPIEEEEPEGDPEEGSEEDPKEDPEEDLEEDPEEEPKGNPEEVLEEDPKEEPKEEELKEEGPLRELASKSPTLTSPSDD